MREPLRPGGVPSGWAVGPLPIGHPFFQGTDATLLQKLKSVHANNKDFLQPKNIHDAQFGIAHFAGQVHYHVEGR